MKAIQKTSGCHLSVLHPEVIEVHSDHQNHKKFKCLRCGLEWKESITSPLLLSEEIEKDIEKHYPGCVNCITE